MSDFAREVEHDAAARKMREDATPRYTTARLSLEIDEAFDRGVEAAAAYHDSEVVRYRSMGKKYAKRETTHQICAAQIRCLKLERPR